MIKIDMRVLSRTVHKTEASFMRLIVIIQVHDIVDMYIRHFAPLCIEHWNVSQNQTKRCVELSLVSIYVAIRIILYQF